MGIIKSSYIFPHPPIIVPEIGKGRENEASSTVNAARRAAMDIAAEKPTTIIITSPHGPVFQDYIYISDQQHLKGSFEGFGCGEVSLEFETNQELTARISEISRNEGIYAGGLDDSTARKYKIDRKLDHGALVPLYFIEKEYRGFRIVHISISGLSSIDLYRFGTCIKRAVEETNERVVFIGSGDLSHKLSKDAPYGFDKRGPEFDKKLVESLRRLDVEALLDMDENLCEGAGECGLRSFIMMFGALDGIELKPEVYSYEGPFGVGYAVARFEAGEKSTQREILNKVQKKNSSYISDIRGNEDPYVFLARKTLETYIEDGRMIKVPEGLPTEMCSEKAGVFVSLKMHGRLRGCIGTIFPVRRNIAEEIINNAISAGTQDPRFSPVESHEMDKLVYSVDVLREPEKIESMDQLNVVRYGVIVRMGNRSGLLLPNIEGVNTPQEQVEIALQKAGIRTGESYSMERFEVIRHK